MNDHPPVDVAGSTARQRLARQVAQAAGTFENMLLHRVPRSVSIVAGEDWMVLHLQEHFDATERGLAASCDGRRRVEAFHHELFEGSLHFLRSHVRRATGVVLQGAVAHVDARHGTVVKTLSTHPSVDLFVLGAGLPGLGVPVDDHRHCDHADGKGPVRQ